VKGRRVQPGPNGWPPALEPGDYCRVAPLRASDGREFTAEERGAWWTAPYWMGCSPNDHTCNLSRHDVLENADGTITVSPSILISDTRGPVWHGYLRDGVWSEY
jgi:hypothetical protein